MTVGTLQKCSLVFLFRSKVTKLLTFKKKISSLESWVEVFGPSIPISDAKQDKGHQCHMWIKDVQRHLQCLAENLHMIARVPCSLGFSNTSILPGKVGHYFLLMDASMHGYICIATEPFF